MSDVSRWIVVFLVGGCMEAMQHERGHDMAMLRFLAELPEGYEIGIIARGVLDAVDAAGAHIEKAARAQFATDGNIQALVGATATKRRMVDTLAASRPRRLVFLRWVIIMEPLGALAVSPDPSNPSVWRVTSFDAGGEPTGHVEAVDFPAAVRCAVDLGGDPLTAEEPETPYS